MNQIEAGVDQSAVQIKNEQADAMGIEAAPELDHLEFRITQRPVLSSGFSVGPGFLG
jgi:hypothetical protein